MNIIFTDDFSNGKFINHIVKSKFKNVYSINISFKIFQAVKIIKNEKEVASTLINMEDLVNSSFEIFFRDVINFILLSNISLNPKIRCFIFSPYLLGLISALNDKDVKPVVILDDSLFRIDDLFWKKKDLNSNISNFLSKNCDIICSRTIKNRIGKITKKKDILGFDMEDSINNCYKNKSEISLNKTFEIVILSGAFDSGKIAVINTLENNKEKSFIIFDYGNLNTYFNELPEYIQMQTTLITNYEYFCIIENILQATLVIFDSSKYVDEFLYHLIIKVNKTTPKNEKGSCFEEEKRLEDLLDDFIC